MYTYYICTRAHTDMHICAHMSVYQRCNLLPWFHHPGPYSILALSGARLTGTLQAPRAELQFRRYGSLLEGLGLSPYLLLYTYIYRLRHLYVGL